MDACVDGLDGSINVDHKSNWIHGPDEQINNGFGVLNNCTTITSTDH